ncbi:MAG TPA: ATP-dependent zinc metalloprotease FtsH [Trueperaceae bacterium]
MPPAEESSPGGPWLGPPADRARSPRDRRPVGPEGDAPRAGPPYLPPGCSWWLVPLALLLLNYLVVALFFPSEGAPVEVPYTLFREQVAAGNVTVVATRADVIEGEFASPVAVTREGRTLLGQEVSQELEVTRFRTTLPSFAGPGLEELLLESGVVIEAEPISEPRSPLLTLLISFGPALLMIGLLLWLTRRVTSAEGPGGLGGALSLGRSRAKRVDAGEVKVTFDDVAGIDEAENELVEIVDFLKNPQKYTRLGGTAPKGVLLVGPPGTGKTLLAKAVAGEAGVPFFSMNASEFVEMIVGVGAARVRDMFAEARKAAPAIVFIDELDAIGRRRGGAIFSGGSSEQEQTLNQILTEMDGMSTKEGVIVLAATNLPEVLDPALLRAGRFDRRVTVLPPDRAGREAILKVHTREVPLAPDVDLGQVAAITPGLVGADLRNLVNEAALLAARRERDAVSQADFHDALEKIILGPERKLLLRREDRERIAYHEAGHAILGLVVPGADPVTRVTITPRGQALGVTYQRPEEDRYNFSEGYLRGRIIGALGGRAAEELVYGDRTTGAENDLQQVTRLAYGMVTRWGMSDIVGPVALAGQEGRFLGGGGDPLPREKPYSEATAEAVDKAARKIVDECYREALRLLTAHRTELERLAAALMEHETLDEKQVLEVTGIPRQVEHRDVPELPPEGV